MIRAMTASVAPSESDPESPMKIWAGWTLNQRNPSSAPMIRAHRKARFGWAGTFRRRDDQERDEGEDERAAGESVEAVGDVHAVARGDDREGGEEDVEHRVDVDRADERNGDLVDLVRPLDQERGGEREHDLPEQLLADADPLARLGVQVVVERAEQARPRRASPSGAKMPPSGGQRRSR